MILHDVTCVSFAKPTETHAFRPFIPLRTSYSIKSPDPLILYYIINFLYCIYIITVHFVVLYTNFYFRLVVTTSWFTNCLLCKGKEVFCSTLLFLPRLWLKWVSVQTLFNTCKDLEILKVFKQWKNGNIGASFIVFLNSCRFRQRKNTNHCFPLLIRLIKRDMGPDYTNYRYNITFSFIWLRETEVRSFFSLKIFRGIKYVLRKPSSPIKSNWSVHDWDSHREFRIEGWGKEKGKKLRTKELYDNCIMKGVYVTFISQRQTPLDSPYFFLELSRL